MLYGIPVALEGDTAASKTSAVLFRAHLLGEAVVRLNLNSHTDAFDLVGRQVPAESTALIDWSNLNSNTQWLTQTFKRLIPDGAAVSLRSDLAVEFGNWWSFNWPTSVITPPVRRRRSVEPFSMKLPTHH